MKVDIKLLQFFRRGVPALVAGLALAPVAIVWDSVPAASASTTSTTTSLYPATLLDATSPTLRAKVTGSASDAGTPTGTVSFAINGSGPVQCDGLTNTVVMSGGVATCKITSALPSPGSPETAQATYGGDDNFAPSNGTYTSNDGTFTADPAPPTPTPSGSTPLLPGETTWSSGAPSYIFGTNDGIDYAEPAFSSLPSVQADVKAGGLTLDRMWAYDDSGGTDAAIMQKVAASENSGMTCMFMLGETDELTWMEHVVTLLGSKCSIYEFGNEPDGYDSLAGNIVNYTSQWIADIPALRAINPNAVFGGPVLQYAESNDGHAGSYSSDMAYFLATTAAAGVRADFISYHDYPCTNATSMANCLSITPGDISYNDDQVLAWEQQYYGTTVPTGISEYNFDPGTNNLYAWGGDSTFMYDWTTTALDAVVASHMAFATQFTSLNYSGYGDLDMFSDSTPYAPKAQFNVLVAEVEKYGGPSTLAIPKPLP